MKVHHIKKEDILRKNIAYRVRTLGGINYLFGSGNCFELNEVANDLWENVNGFDSVGEIIEVIASDYQMKPENIEEDILSFIDNMMGYGVYQVI